MLLEIGPDETYRAIGFAGIALFIGAYALLQAGRLRGSGYTYPLCNLIAASLILASLRLEFHLVTAVINVLWIAISLFGLVRRAVLDHRIRFYREERDMLADAFPDMPRPLARRLLDGGVWATWPAGAELTVEGEEVEHLHYIASGGADVISSGRRIARIEKGLVGEMNVIGGGPASATVRLTSHAYVFTVSATVLRHLSARDREMDVFLERHLSRATRRRLTEANSRLPSWTASA